MSRGNRDLEVVKVISPELQLGNVRKYVSLKGALAANSISYPAANPTTSSIAINIVPPNQNTIISRHMLKKFVFTQTITGTNTSGSPTLLQPGFIAPRAWPIMSVTNTESITINNTSLTQAPMNQYWPAFLWYSNKFGIRNGTNSMAHSSMDKFQNYTDGVGSIINPLLGYEASGFEPGRASNGFVILSNGPTGATVQITSIEPILVSPFAMGEEAFDTPGLIGVNSMQYNAVLTNINRVLSQIVTQGVTGINITSVSTVVNSAELELTYYTPDPTQGIPRELISSYYNVINNTTSSNQNVAPGAVIGIQMNAIQLTGIPKRIIVFCGNNPSTITADVTGALSDTYLSLAQTNPLTMQFNNNNYFGSYTQEQLYQISVSNGCDMSWAQWAGQVYGGQIVGGKVGSILCLEFGKDIALNDPSLSPGVLGSFQLQLTTNWLNTNPTQTIINPTLFCVVIYEGTFTIRDGFCSADTNILSQEDVLLAKPASGIVPHNLNKSVYGGLFEGFANALSNASKFLRDTKLISGVSGLIPHPAAQAISQGAKTLGYGAKPKKRGAALVGGRKPLAQRVRGAGLFIENSDEDDEYNDEYSE